MAVCHVCIDHSMQMRETHCCRVPSGSAWLLVSFTDGQLQKEQAKKIHSRDSSVVTVTRLRARRPTNRLSIPDRSGEFPSSKRPVRFSDPQWLERDYFLGVKAA